MKISVVIATLTVLLTIACLHAEARSSKHRNVIDFLNRIRNRMLEPRMVRSAVSDQEDDDEDYEDYEEEPWGTMEDAHYFIEIFDSDRDGKMDTQDLLGFFEYLMFDEPESRRRITEIFDVVKDKDGYLTAEEVHVAIKHGLL